jgi:hypothetical protein
MTASRALAAASLLLTTAVGLTACGGRTESRSSNRDDSSNGGGSSNDGSSFPFGVYSDCTWISTGGTFEGAASSASLTLAPSGSAVVATYQSEGQPTVTFDLRTTSNASATLTVSGQGFAGEWGFCGGGAVGFGQADPESTQATLSMSSAELTVDQGVVFIQMEGPVVNVQGKPGCAPDGPPSAPVSALLACGAPSAGDGSNRGADAGAPTTETSRFVTGSYDCSSTVYTYNAQDSVAAGSAGTLTLTAVGSNLDATYSGDTFASGTLDFTVTSDSSANPVAGQTLDVACGGFDPTTWMSTSNPTVTQVSAGALTTDGTTLYLAFLGTVPSGTCSGQTSSTALQCIPKTQ